MNKQKRDEIAILCHNIRQLRRKENLSKREMARKLAIGEYSLTKIEKGILPPRLSCEIIFQIDKEFGIRPKELFSTIEQ